MSSSAQGIRVPRTHFKQRHFIDLHKGLMAPFILAVMAYHHAWHNIAAWLYLATHGVYGVLWVLKSRVFPDKQFDQPCGVGFAALIWTGLSLYWISPWIIVAHNVQPPPWYLGLCVALCIFGVFFHFVSDMQKHMHLALQPGRLLTQGLWTRCRNPNYFGELLIYAGFGAMAMHWLPFLVLALFIGAVWIPNMLRKDKSLSRYPEFAAWKKHSTLLIPYVL